MNNIKTVAVIKKLSEYIEIVNNFILLDINLFLYTLLLWIYIVKLFEYWLNQDTETLIQQENICSLYTFLYYTCLKQNSRKFPYENASNDVVRADRMVDRTRLSLSLGEIRWK